MQLTTNIDIEDGIVTASIVCTDISDETKEALHDYTKMLRYGNIDFSAKIKVSNNMPVSAARRSRKGTRKAVRLGSAKHMTSRGIFKSK